MDATLSEIFIDGERVDYSAGTLTKEGGNTASKLTFTVPGDDVTYRKYWGKEVTFFLNQSDAFPLFRGFIENAEILDNFSIGFRALDALGYLTGLDRASVVLDDIPGSNIDGLTIGAALRKLIEMSKLTNIGVDYLRDTTPVQQMPRIRGRVFILDTIVNELSRIYTIGKAPVAISGLPRQNILKVADDGTKGQLVFELLKQPETSIPIHHFSYDTNIISFQVQNRKIPTIVSVKGEKRGAIFKHEGAISAFGEHTVNVDNPLLKSQAECVEFGSKVFNANLNVKYEYALTTFEGGYLEENDVVNIIDDTTEVEGNFRIVGKTISFGPTGHTITLNINKQPPLLSQFLVT